MMTTEQWFFGVLSLILIGGCAGAGAGAQEPEPSSEEESMPPSMSAEDDGSVEEPPVEPQAESVEEAKAPEFRPGMSVDEAVNAVPETGQRLNIEEEVLAEPLMDAELYEPCALQGHHHFKLRVAVWDGRAVGVDVTTKPPDQKLEACLRQQLMTVEWSDKAKSMNTVEYNY